MSITNIHLLKFTENLKSLIKTRTLNAGISPFSKEKTSRIFNITFSILDFYQKKRRKAKNKQTNKTNQKRIAQLNDHPEYFGMYILIFIKGSNALQDGSF